MGSIGSLNLFLQCSCTAQAIARKVEVLFTVLGVADVLVFITVMQRLLYLFT